MDLTNPRLRLPIVILLILSAGVLVYANSFQVPFVLDDTPSIVDNKAIRSLSNFYPYGSGYFLPGRSVAYLSFALNYHFSGLDVVAYHAVNLIVHLISALLVYALLRLTFSTPYFWDDSGQSVERQETRSGIRSFFASRMFIPLFAALLFVVHPVQTQAVTYIVQRMTSLATMFYLLSLVLYVMARLSGGRGEVGAREPAENSPSAVASGRIKPGLLIFGAVLSALLAMLTKPIAFTLPLAVLLYEFCFFDGTLRKRMLYLTPLLATLPVIPLTIIGAGGTSDNILLDAGDHLRVGSDISRFDYLFTQFRVIVTYLRLLVFPVNQNLDYDHPVYSTFFTPPVFFSFLLLAAVFGAALFLFLATRRIEGSPSALRERLPACLVDPAARLVAFGLCWFFLALSVESSFVPIVDLLVEHRLYLPSVGIAAAFSAALFLLAGSLSRSAGAKLLPPVSLALVLALGFATWQRNQVWGDAVRLWTDVVEKSPNKGRASNNLGVALEQIGRRADAFRMLSRAIEVDPGYYKAYYNLADLYLVSDQPDEALPLLQAAIRLQPQFTEAYVKMGAALMRSGRFFDVTAFLEQNLERVKEQPEARFYLGSAYAFLGNRQAAMRELEILTRFDSAFAATLSGLLRSKSNHGFIHGSN